MVNLIEHSSSVSESWYYLNTLFISLPPSSYTDIFLLLWPAMVTLHKRTAFNRKFSCICCINDIYLYFGKILTNESISYVFHNEVYPPPIFRFPWLTYVNSILSQLDKLFLHQFTSIFEFKWFGNNACSYNRCLFP